MYLLPISENNTVKSEFHNYLLTKIFTDQLYSKYLKRNTLETYYMISLFEISGRICVPLYLATSCTVLALPSGPVRRGLGIL